MNKRGFTLIEVLVVIIIIGLISGIGIVAYNAFFDTAKDKYYDSLESNMLLAGNDYFEDHRDLLPLGNDYSIVSLANLIEDKYIDPVKDSAGKECLEGTVFAYRENNKFKYEACLKCENYESSGSFCEGPASKKITATGKKVGTNEAYNVTKSYNSQEYSNGKDIEVTYSMANEIPVAKYVTTNTSNSSIKKECTASNNSCSVIIDSSGTYKVVAYDNENKEISSIYISAKIAKGTLAYRLEGETKYLLGLEECNGDKKATVTINIIRETQEEYKRIMYRINGGSSKEATGLKIVEELESGHYTIEVVVIEHTNKETLREFDLDVSYEINYEYDDDHTTGTHEVIKGKTYNFLSSLPKKKESYGHNLDIKWIKDNVEIDPDTKIVEDNCTHQLIGRMSIPVTVPSDLTAYCNTLTYTGDEQTLTKAAPENITFLNNKGTNAGEYTVKAHINSPQYIWSDGTFDDKEFKCIINPIQPTIACTSPTYTGSSQTIANCTNGSITENGTATNAGSYTVKCEGTGNYAALASEECSINAAQPTISCIARTYNGSSQTIANCTNGNITENGTATNAGSYTVKCSGTGNYGALASKSCSINAAQPTISCIARTYNGSSQTIASCTNGNITENGTATNVGSYTVKCIGTGNYAALASLSCSISAPTPTPTPTPPPTVNPNTPTWCHHNTYDYTNQTVCEGAWTDNACCQGGCPKVFLENQSKGAINWKCSNSTGTATTGGSCWIQWSSRTLAQCTEPPGGSSSSTSNSTSCCPELPGNPCHQSIYCYYNVTSMTSSECARHGYTWACSKCYRSSIGSTCR